MALEHNCAVDKTLVNALVTLTNKQLLALLQEVFRRRDYKLPHTEVEVRRWFVVEQSGLINSSSGYLEPNSLLDPEYLALPVSPTTEDEFFQGGICDACGLILTCTDKMAMCPFCGSVVQCT